MSVRVISGIAGAFTTIGGVGIGIYLFNNSKNNTNKPSPKKVIPHKTARQWTQIIQSDEYKTAITTGKLFDVISYQDEEIAEGNGGYVLLEMNWSKTILDKKINKVEIWWDSESIATETIDSATNEFNVLDFPLMCFENKNQDPKELNFNDLKGCSVKFNESETIFSHKYVVISFRVEEEDVDDVQKHKFHQLHSEKPTLKIELNYENSNTTTWHDARVLKVFNNKYVPSARLKENITTST